MRSLWLVIGLLLSACQITPITPQPVAVLSKIADGRLQNQLVRQLTQRGYTIAPQAPQSIIILKETFSQTPALSGSDNVTQNSWLNLTVCYQIKQKQHLSAIQTRYETRLLRHNYSQALAAAQEARAIKHRLRTVLATRIALALKLGTPRS
jgi:outer membrane lipopolysaccharide assembly protein LptE/RlpB